ncbi:MAG: CTP synthase [Candidatus Aenigmarchaeota archaeon]|nr:CTP synthase [Candidatus Aenigmarchaeota archaeon]
MRFIFVTGGVISGVGKGLATASIAKILQQYGYTATAVKIDPYINYDAGTLRPTEHGEVWVTDDGGEIDQDLGNYERFLGFELPKKNNITTGQVYKELIDKERRGEFLGQTVEVIPHVPNEIKRRIKEAGSGFDFVVVEVGGTIGDYQNLPYLFAAKGLELEFGKNNVAYVLVTYLPVPSNIGEMKTKPTQQAIRMLNEAGIFPDFVLCRAPVPLDDVRKKKLETNANIDADNVISAPDVDNIYKVPLNLESEDLGKKLLKHFGVMPLAEPDWTNWKRLVENMNHPKKTVNIAMVGKYIDIGHFSLTDSYISVNQALLHAGAEFSVKVNIDWVDAKKIEKEGTDCLKVYDGIVVPGGFGASGVEGKIKAIEYTRTHNLPFLGLCYGLQLAVAEYARNVCGMQTANTTEVDPNTICPVIDILPTQKSILAEGRYGASMRLGAYAAILKEKSRVLDLYKRTGRLEEDLKRIEEIKKNGQAFRLGIIDGQHNVVIERHRHRYEVNPTFVQELEKAGLVFSGFHHREDGTKLMEYIELPNHRFFVATQAHPEFKSRLGNPSPLFFGFIEACCKN